MGNAPTSAPGAEVRAEFEPALELLFENLIPEKRSPAAAFHIRTRRERAEMAQGTEVGLRSELEEALGVAGGGGE